MTTTREIGRKGEDQVILFLQYEGYSIKETNYRWGFREVDIIMEDETHVIFVEVKTRKSDSLVEGYDSVSEAQQQRIIELADHYVNDKKIDKLLRFDIVDVEYNEHDTLIYHIKDAFYPVV